ncbi:MAG: VOC family protein [Gemmatimonadales bacterium]|nr:VOC family protein [Gemmatimonadales bacterium]
MTSPTAAPAPAIGRIGQIALSVQDLDRATAFYRDTLGLKHLFTAPPGMAFFDCGGVRLLLGKEELGHTPFVLYYQVADLQTAHAAIAARGAAVISAPHRVARLPDHDLWLGEYRDSEGHAFALMHEVRPPAAA